MLIHTDITVEPLLRVAEILNKAMTRNLIDWNAMNIATVSSDGQPSSRMVLLKKIDDRGFVFYSNFNSQKGQEIELNNLVALNFWWRELKEQIRVEGSIEKLSPEESDEYFNSRPLQSRVAAIVSKQSEKIESHEKLNAEIQDLTKKFQETREEPEWLSLNLIFIVALVTAGITFDALLPVSTEVIARVDGSKCSVPASS